MSCKSDYWAIIIANNQQLNDYPMQGEPRVMNPEQDFVITHNTSIHTDVFEEIVSNSMTLKEMSGIFTYSLKPTLKNKHVPFYNNSTSKHFNQALKFVFIFTFDKTRSLLSKSPFCFDPDSNRGYINIISVT